jgi:5-methylthioribose kinase
MPVWNPSFDVTPGTLIRGIITEVGVAEPTTGNSSTSFDLPQFLLNRGLNYICQNATLPTESNSPGYSPLNSNSMKEYVLNSAILKSILAFTSDDDSDCLEISEVGDGNLNYVFLISNNKSKTTVVVKQALPYVRCIGDSWPLTLHRAIFERKALETQRQSCEELVPKVYCHDDKMFMFAMEYIAPPSLVVRKCLMGGIPLPKFSDDISTFLAETLFKTSAFSLNGPSFRRAVSEWSQNYGLCALTEKVIFTDPFTICSMNHWTSPYLDNYAQEIREDSHLKLAVLRLKEKFLSCPQALLHGDLHTGSVMASELRTLVIDPEFA